MLEALEGAGGDAPCAILYAGDCGGWVLFAIGAGGDGGDAPCATLYAGGWRGWALFAGGAESDEVMRCGLLCMLEAVEGELCWLEALEVPGAMRRVLLCMLETVEGGLCLLGMLEVMRCVLLRIPETVKGGLCLLEVVEVPEVIKLCATRCAVGCGVGSVSGFRNFHCGVLSLQSAGLASSRLSCPTCRLSRPRLNACSAPPGLLRQPPTRPYTRNTPPELHTSTSPQVGRESQQVGGVEVLANERPAQGGPKW